MQFRIGDRDPVTGLYDVIWPDGSFTRNGLKIFNSAHQFGDVVLATQRSDGMMILDSVKADASTDQTTNANAAIAIQKFGEQPIGYLNGQTWNDEDELKKPTVSIDFVLGSPTSIQANQGNFTIRFTVNRLQSKDLKIRCGFAGTFPQANYTTFGLDANNNAIIPTGQSFVDITITPSSSASSQSRTIVISILPSSDYRGEGSVTATVERAPIFYRVTKAVGIESSGSTSQNVAIGYYPADLTKKAAIVFSITDQNLNPVLAEQDITINYTLFGAQPGIIYVLPPNAVQESLISVLGSIVLPTGASSVTLFLTRISTGTILASLANGDYINGGGLPAQVTFEDALSISLNIGGGSGTPSQKTVSQESGIGNIFVFTASQPVRGDTIINVINSGVSLSNYQIATNSSIFNPSLGTIEILNGATTANLTLYHKYVPRIPSGQDTLDLSVAAGAYQIEAQNRAILVTTSRAALIYSYDQPNHEVTPPPCNPPLPLYNGFVPAQYFTTSSLIISTSTLYRYINGNSGQTVASFERIFDPINNNAQLTTVYRVNGFGNQVPENNTPPNETLAGRRARLSAEPGSVEQVLPTGSKKRCTYTEA